MTDNGCLGWLISINSMMLGWSHLDAFSLSKNTHVTLPVMIALVAVTKMQQCTMSPSTATSRPTLSQLAKLQVGVYSTRGSPAWCLAHDIVAPPAKWVYIHNPPTQGEPTIEKRLLLQVMMMPRLASCSNRGCWCSSFHATVLTTWVLHTAFPAVPGPSGLSTKWCY